MVQIDVFHLERCVYSRRNVGMEECRNVEDAVLRSYVTVQVNILVHPIIVEERSQLLH